MGLVRSLLPLLHIFCPWRSASGFHTLRQYCVKKCSRRVGRRSHPIVSWRIAIPAYDDFLFPYMTHNAIQSVILQRISDIQLFMPRFPPGVSSYSVFVSSLYVLVSPVGVFFSAALTLSWFTAKVLYRMTYAIFLDCYCRWLHFSYAKRLICVESSLLYDLVARRSVADVNIRRRSWYTYFLTLTFFEVLCSRLS